MKIAVTFFSFKRIKPKKVLFKDIKEGPIWFCHFQEKKSLTSDLWLKEGIWHSLCRRKIYKLLDQFDVLAEPKTRFYNSEMTLRNIFWFFLFLFFWVGRGQEAFGIPYFSPKYRVVASGSDWYRRLCGHPGWKFTPILSDVVQHSLVKVTEQTFSRYKLLEGLLTLLGHCKQRMIL